MTRVRFWAIALSVLTVIASVVVCRLAWELAPGIVEASPSTYEVDFLDPGVMRLVWLLPLAVAVVCALDPRVGAAAGLGVLLPVTVAIHADVEQYAATGWGDGLEVLGYAQPVFLGMLCLVLGAVASVLGRRLRRGDHDQ